MSTSNFKELPKKQEDFTRKKKVKEEEAGSGNTNKDTVNN
jgi:hypothetical protein